MAVKVFWGRDGPYAEAETPAEAIELIRLGSNGHRKYGSQNIQPTGDSVPKQLPLDRGELVRRLSYELTERTKKFLLKLVSFPGGVEGPEFSEAVKEPVEAFGGILGAISKAAIKSGLNPNDLVKSEMRFEGPRRFRFLRPGEVLTEYSDRMTAGGGGVRSHFPQG
jgi:hypothetical protein